MNIAIIGSRTFTDKEKVETILEWYKCRHTGIDGGIHMKIITGGANGPDMFSIDWCKKQPYMQYEIIRPINPANKLDYLFRNVEIITKADKIIAFWDGKSKGTKFVIDYAKARKKDITIIRK